LTAGSDQLPYAMPLHPLDSRCLDRSDRNGGTEKQRQGPQSRGGCDGCHRDGDHDGQRPSREPLGAGTPALGEAFHGGGSGRRSPCSLSPSAWTLWIAGRGIDPSRFQAPASAPAQEACCPGGRRGGFQAPPLPLPDCGISARHPRWSKRSGGEPSSPICLPSAGSRKISHSGLEGRGFCDCANLSPQ